ncbi:MAG TPA: hypothetical protein VHN14_35980 [Kofleriaceae bacterium]|nr:hypothetical protein [Kofleriaceae bacterium]
MRGTIFTAVLFAAALGGCYTTGTVGYSSGYYAGGGANVYVNTPDLVTVSPGVQVVADYDEPVFYTDGFYWRFYDGYWYRSNNYASGWYYYERPPVAVLRIDRPYAYAHYRPAGYAARSRGAYRPPEAIVRDHRQPEYRPEPVVREPTYRQNTVVRDHREPTYQGGPTYREGPPASRPAPVTRPPTPAPAPASAPAPVVRDHRQPAPAPAAAPARTETRDHRH